MRLQDIAPEGEIVHASKVTHVTFYIIKHPTEERFKLFSESKKYGAQELYPHEFEHNYSGYFEAYEDAENALTIAIEKLEQTLERKQNGTPTKDQLYFFFRNKIPIPIDLTWGQAFDLIENWLTENSKRKKRNS